MHCLMQLHMSKVLGYVKNCLITYADLQVVVLFAAFPTFVPRYFHHCSVILISFSVLASATWYCEFKIYDIY